jgi:hypothetical protein
MNPSNVVFATIMTYLSFTFVFFVVKARSSLTGMNHLIALLTFVFLSGLLQFFANVGLSKRHCGEVDMKVVTYATLFPWIFILVGFTLTLNTLPGWLRVFSNTFGAFVLRQSGLTDLVVKLYENHMPPANNEKMAKEMLEQIYTNKSALILELNIEDVTEKDGIYSFPALEELVNLKIINKPENDLVKNIYHKLLLKDEIGYFCWYTLVGTFFILVSTNTLLSTTCSPKKR